MDPAGYEFYRSNKRNQSVLHEIIEPDDSANIYKMCLPSSLEIVPPRNNFLEFIKRRESIGLELLPVFDIERNTVRQKTKYDFALNDIMAVTWSNYQAKYMVSFDPPVVPSARDVRFECQKVPCPDSKAGKSGKRMTEGANLDAPGPVPVPADVYHRYRAKMAMIKSQRSKKPFK